LCENVEALCENGEKRNSYNKIYIRIQQEKYVNDVMKKLKPVCIQYKGNIPIYLYVSENKRSFLINKNLWINSDKEILTYLKNSFGEENVKAV